jgi:chorismate mutase/prephenate dehydrogenase
MRPTCRCRILGRAMEIAALRRRLDRIDRTILELAAARQRLVGRIEEEKARAGGAIRDYARERAVLEGAERTAARVDLDPALARRLMEGLIRASLTVQERQRVVSRADGSGKRALVIGGAGRMGDWFVQFLNAQGYDAWVADPAGQGAGQAWWSDWREAPTDVDLTVVATPLRIGAEILRDLIERRPEGVVLEIGSVKAPLETALKRLADSGVDVVSIHPLFGPDTELLSGRHVALIDLGRPRATATARDLFASTMAIVVEMGLAEHDRLMAWILGLSHALSLAFAEALRSGGIPIEDVARLASTTFDEQLRVARRVVSENPALYFEIQHLNPQGREVLAALHDAVARLAVLIEDGDEAAFVHLMQMGSAHLLTTQARNRRSTRTNS